MYIVIKEYLLKREIKKMLKNHIISEDKFLLGYIFIGKYI
jgi:hypothetical protein